MPADRLERSFAARMMPLAAFATVVVATVPPVTYWVIGRDQLRRQAQVYAGQIAGGLVPVVQRQPYLWRYNTSKVLQATMLHRGQSDIGAVRVTDCQGRSLYSGTGLGVGSGAVDGPRGWAQVRGRGKLVAWVEVRMDETDLGLDVTRIAGVASLLGLVVGLLLYIFPTRTVRHQAVRLRAALDQLRGAEQQLTEANRSLAQRVAAAVAEVRALSGRVLSVQEEERRRIARDLHDGIGQSMAALQAELELSLSRPGEAEQHLRAGIEVCGQAVADLRRAVRELRPVELERAGLVEALQGCAERFELRTGIATSFRLAARAGISCSEQVATCVLRVLQEALTNVGRHAHAGEVGVMLDQDGDGLVMDIHDDGSGLPADAESHGSGLQGMRERCQLLGGTLEVSSRPGQGTRLTVRLPAATPSVTEPTPR